MAKWVPTEGGGLNCQLPGELTRAQVITVVSENVAIVQITAAPISKLHGYVYGQTVPCRRKLDDMGQEAWIAVSEAEMALAAEEDEQAAEARKKVAEAEAARAQALGPKIHAFNVVTE